MAHMMSGAAQTDVPQTDGPPSLGHPRKRAVDYGLRLSGRALLIAVVIYFTVPMLAVVLYGIATRWTDHALPDGYTIAHWGRALTNWRFLAALFRSLVLAAAVALLDLALVTPAVYWQHVRHPGLRPVIEILASIPLALPFVVLAFGLLSLTGQYAPALQGTLWLLVSAQAAAAFSLVYWTVDGAMAGANVKALAETATVCGAGIGTTLFRIILPNIGPGLMSAVTLAFTLSFNEVALAQILVGNRYETVQLYMLNMLKSADADFNLLAVMTCVSFVIALSLAAVAARLRRWPPGAGSNQDDYTP